MIHAASRATSPAARHGPPGSLPRAAAPPPAAIFLLLLALDAASAPGARAEEAADPGPQGDRKQAAAGGTLLGAGRRLAPELKVGARVEVRLEVLRDGAWRAEEIRPRQEEDDEEELRGLIEAVDSGSRRLEMLGFSVQVGSDTDISREPAQPATFADLSPGLRVKVEGRRDPGGLFLAEEVRIRQLQHHERRIAGSIEGLEIDPRGRARMRLLGREVLVDEATRIAGARLARPALTSRRLGVLDEDDLLFTGKIRFGRYLGLAGEFRLRATRLSNPDLDRSDPDSETVPEILGILGLLAEFGPVFAYAEVTGEREYFLRGGDGLAAGEERGFVRVGEAYVQVSPFGALPLSVALGRQKFNEKREWHYNNKNLDAVRLLADFHPFTFEASASRDLFDETRNLPDQELSNLILRAAWQANEDLGFEGFYISRKDRTELDDSPRILGLRAMGEAGRHVDFWVDVAREGGTRCWMRAAPSARWRECDRVGEPGGEVDVRKVRAHAFDAGLTLRPRTALDPSFTAGVALGSGDDDLNLAAGQQLRGADETFRQSGLHRNRDRWNGVVSFRYYGEAFDPELSNLRILTLGMGLRPVRSFSVDLVYHRYRQDVAAREITEGEIDEDPSGEDPDLGSEWDLVVGYEPLRDVELRLTAGRFEPGGAFPDASASTVIALQSKFRF